MFHGEIDAVTLPKFCPRVRRSVIIRSDSLGFRWGGGVYESCQKPNCLACKWFQSANLCQVPREELLPRVSLFRVNRVHYKFWWEHLLGGGGNGTSHATVC